VRGPGVLSGLGGHEPLVVTGAAGVVPARGAGAGRGARYRSGVGVPALVQGRQAGYLYRRAPRAAVLAGHSQRGACREETSQCLWLDPTVMSKRLLRAAQLPTMRNRSMAGSPWPSGTDGLFWARPEGRGLRLEAVKLDGCFANH
jgi:hypothetical protein